MGVYIKGVKVGYAGSVQKEDTFQGKKATKTWSINVLKTQMLGSDLDVRFASTTWTDPQGKPLRMEFRNSSEGRTQVIQADFEPKKILVVVDNNGQKQKSVITIEPGMNVVDDATGLAAELLGKGVNARKKVHVLDPTTVSLVENELVYKGRENITLGKDEVSADVVDVVDPRATTRVFFDGNQSVLKVTGPMGMELFPEAKTVAMDLSGSAGKTVDLAISTSLKVEPPIQNANQLKSLKMKVTGVDLSRIPSDAHQTVTAEGIWTIHPTRPQEKSATESRFLKPSHLIESDDPEIKGLAKKLRGELADTVGVAERIRAYVNEQMRVNTGIGVLRNAKEVLKTKEGLCRDHAILCAALLRASGIPTKLVSGLVYDQDAFYYHAWVEYWAGNWVGLDSTRTNEFLPAIYMKLADGEVSDAFLFFVLDGAKIEVMEANR